VLVHNGGRIYESGIINEYLNEAFPEPPLLPSEPMVRAQARIWMDYCGSHLSPASWSHMQAGDDPDKLTAATSELHSCFEFMETAGLRQLSDGPYWLGASLSLVDIQFMPFFQRFLDRDLQDIPADCTRLRAWLETISTQETFIATAKEA